MRTKNASNHTGAGHDLAMALRRAYLTMHRGANAQLAEFFLTADQFVLLAALAEAAPMPQKNLVAHSASDPNTISGMLGRLEERGLVQRSPSREDKRLRLVALTAKGRQLHRKAAKKTVAFRTSLAASFNGRERDQLLQLLERISHTTL